MLKHTCEFDYSIVNTPKYRLFHCIFLYAFNQFQINTTYQYLTNHNLAKSQPDKNNTQNELFPKKRREIPQRRNFRENSALTYDSEKQYFTRANTSVKINLNLPLFKLDSYLIGSKLRAVRKVERVGEDDPAAVLPYTSGRIHCTNVPRFMIIIRRKRSFVIYRVVGRVVPAHIAVAPGRRKSAKSRMLNELAASRSNIYETYTLFI